MALPERASLAFEGVVVASVDVFRATPGAWFWGVLMIACGEGGGFWGVVMFCVRGVGGEEGLKGLV